MGPPATQSLTLSSPQDALLAMRLLEEALEEAPTRALNLHDIYQDPKGLRGEIPHPSLVFILAEWDWDGRDAGGVFRAVVRLESAPGFYPCLLALVQSTLRLMGLPKMHIALVFSRDRALPFVRFLKAALEEEGAACPLEAELEEALAHG